MRATIFVVSLAVAQLIACGGSDATLPVQASVGGTWTLQSQNGSPLPFLLGQQGLNKFELLSDAMVATATGSFTRTRQYRSTVSGQVTTESTAETGTWVLSGSTITFTTTNPASTRTGFIIGNAMTLGVAGAESVYQKQ